MIFFRIHLFVVFVFASVSIKQWFSLVFVLLFLYSHKGFTQKNIQKKEVKIEKKKAKMGKKAEKLALGKFMITPFAAPGYTPELGGLLAVGGLASFKTKSTDTLIQRSSIPFSFAYTSTGAIVANAILSSFWFKDKVRVFGDFWLKDMPDHYWGVGYKNGATTPKSDSTTAFNRMWWWINPRILYQVKKDYFVGLNIDYNYTQGSNPSPVVSNNPNYIEFNDKPMNSGIGLILRYDSRDIPVDAREGVYIDGRATFYNESLGGDNNYQIYFIDYRQFQTLHRLGSTLAWQARTRIGVGEIPYGEMSQLGTPFDLRGYTWGQYRDKSLFFFLVEYRHTFLKADKKLSKHGAVFWVGSGTVFDRQSAGENTNRWLPNVGLGYRFEVQPRMNLRLDFGIGRESSGFYFNFNQAF
ncbi:MAG: BamA/TamA family outer membrane protein [Cyclobacteriaceae bacterium]|nr:BamA/TamA family outer membrane protein [Cyclobacteriaceae bacterium]